MTSTLAARIALVMLAAHAVLLPGLYFGLMQVTERELADQFIAEVRGFSRVVADEFEIGLDLILDGLETAMSRPDS